MGIGGVGLYSGRLNPNSRKIEQTLQHSATSHPLLILCCISCNLTRLIVEICFVPIKTHHSAKKSHLCKVVTTFPDLG